MRLSDSIEAISEAFVVGEFEQPAGAVQFQIQKPARPDRWRRPTRNPLRGRFGGREQAHRAHAVVERGPARAVPGARTFEAQLEDGRWLQISERRTKDGGFVSVGTNITEFEAARRAADRERKRLKATVVDLRSSQQAMERQTEQLAYLAERYAEQKDRAGGRRTRQSRRSWQT